MHTTPSYTYGTDYDDFEYNYVQLIAKPKWITFIVLTCILNLAVISCIVYLYVKRPTSRTSPHLVIILVLSVVVTVFTLVCHSFGVSYYNRVESDKPLYYDCSTLVAVEVMAYMEYAIANLLVAGVIVAEALKLQKFVVINERARKEVAVVLSVLPVLYGLVTIPVFLFNMTLDNVMEPCVTNNNNTFICIFIVPQCVIFISSADLLAVYISQRCFCYPSGNAKLSHQSTNTTMVLNNSYMNFNRPINGPEYSGKDQARISVVQTSRSSTSSPVQIKQQRPSFPFYALLAATVSFSTGFMVFFYKFVEYGDLNMTYRE